LPIKFEAQSSPKLVFVYVSGLGARFGDLLFALPDSGLAWDSDVYNIGLDVFSIRLMRTA